MPVFAIGIGRKIFQDELIDIAGSAKRIMQVDDFSAIGQKANDLLTGVCLNLRQRTNFQLLVNELVSFFRSMFKQ